MSKETYSRVQECMTPHLVHVHRHASLVVDTHTTLSLSLSLSPAHTHTHTHTQMTFAGSMHICMSLDHSQHACLHVGASARPAAPPLGRLAARALRSYPPSQPSLFRLQLVRVAARCPFLTHRPLFAGRPPRRGIREKLGCTGRRPAPVAGACFNRQLWARTHGGRTSPFTSAPLSKVSMWAPAQDSAPPVSALQYVWFLLALPAGAARESKRDRDRDRDRETCETSR